MPEEKVCLRCGGGALIAAQLENPISFCVDHDVHHGPLHLCLKALLCKTCGHVEFWLSDPCQIVSQCKPEEASVIQEEDF